MAMIGPATTGSLRSRIAAIRRQRGIRLQSVAAAVVVVSVALLVAGFGLLYVLRGNLEATARTAATTRGAEVAAMVRTQGVQNAGQAIQAESRSGQLVQILSADGTVAGSSSQVVRSTPMSAQRPATGKTTISEEDLDHVGPGGEWVVSSTGVSADDTRYVVQVAVPIEGPRETLKTVGLFLLVLSPALVLAVAIAVWIMVGRALRAVERIRAEVATIDDQRLSQRVDVPPTHDEMAALAVTMNAMLNRLETSQRAQRAFVSDASHELRSPLATLTTATELAAAGNEATRTRLLGTIAGELGRLRRLVENLMTLARADADDLLEAREDVDLDDLLDAEARRLRATSTLLVAARLEPVRLSGGDTQRLAQALRNLVDNAERHARTTIRLSVHARDGVGAAGVVPDGVAVLRVDDDGDPVPEADRERIFERFVRLDESRSRDGGGSGLGLAIARTAVASHGGTVRTTTTEEGWCRFEITLPLAAGPSPARPVPPDRAITAPPAEQPEPAQAEHRFDATSLSVSRQSTGREG